MWGLVEAIYTAPSRQLLECHLRNTLRTFASSKPVIYLNIHSCPSQLSLILWDLITASIFLKPFIKTKGFLLKYIGKIKGMNCVSSTFSPVQSKYNLEICNKKAQVKKPEPLSTLLFQVSFCKFNELSKSGCICNSHISQYLTV